MIDEDTQDWTGYSQDEIDEAFDNYNDLRIDEMREVAADVAAEMQLDD